jgi:hypothetical protein
MGNSGVQDIVKKVARERESLVNKGGSTVISLLISGWRVDRVKWQTISRSRATFNAIEALTELNLSRAWSG